MNIHDYEIVHHKDNKPKNLELVEKSCKEDDNTKTRKFNTLTNAQNTQIVNRLNNDKNYRQYQTHD